MIAKDHQRRVSVREALELQKKAASIMIFWRPDGILNYGDPENDVCFVTVYE